jgi:biotin carboxyl carrier protein
MTNQPFQVTINDKILEITPQDAAELDIIADGDAVFHILKNQKSYKAEIQSVDYLTKTFTFKINGSIHTAKINDMYDRLIDQLGMKVGVTQKVGDIKAPMPGLVIEVAVEVGQTVSKGDKVLILEAMKMENVIKAAGDGIVKAIHTKNGQPVEKGQLLIEMEA